MPDWQTGVSKALKFTPGDEPGFQKDYANLVETLGLDPNPNDPRHFYDYRKAWKAGLMNPGPGGHLPSQFKTIGHPNRFVGGEDTMTGQGANLFDMLMNMFKNTAVHAQARRER